MSMRLTLLATWALIGTVGQPAEAQTRPWGSIDGVVTDTSLASLPEATVSILGSSIQVITGANGRFRILALPAGQYIVVVHRLGYIPTSATVQIGGRDTLRMSFALERITTMLDTVVVTAQPFLTRMSEFEARRKLGIGHFMTLAEIDKRDAVFAADLLRPFLSVNIVSRGATQYAVSLRDRGCPFQVYVDGLAQHTPLNLADLPSPRQLAGIEVYSGAATIPLQYKRANSGCGVILIWTKT